MSFFSFSLEKMEAVRVVAEKVDGHLGISCAGRTDWGRGGRWQVDPAERKEEEPGGRRKERERRGGGRGGENERPGERKSEEGGPGEKNKGDRKSVV